jgi:hypothetical protein
MQICLTRGCAARLVALYCFKFLSDQLYCCHRFLGRCFENLICAIRIEHNCELHFTEKEQSNRDWNPRLGVISPPAS